MFPASIMAVVAMVTAISMDLPEIDGDLQYKVFTRNPKPQT